MFLSLSVLLSAPDVHMPDDRLDIWGGKALAVFALPYEAGRVRTARLPTRHRASSSASPGGGCDHRASHLTEVAGTATAGTATAGTVTATAGTVTSQQCRSGSTRAPVPQCPTQPAHLSHPKLMSDPPPPPDDRAGTSLCAGAFPADTQCYCSERNHLSAPVPSRATSPLPSPAKVHEADGRRLPGPLAVCAEPALVAAPHAPTEVALVKSLDPRGHPRARLSALVSRGRGHVGPSWSLRPSHMPPPGRSDAALFPDSQPLGGRLGHCPRLADLEGDALADAGRPPLCGTARGPRPPRGSSDVAEEKLSPLCGLLCPRRLPSASPGHHTCRSSIPSPSRTGRSRRASYDQL